MDRSLYLRLTLLRLVLLSGEQRQHVPVPGVGDEVNEIMSDSGEASHVDRDGRTLDLTVEVTPPPASTPAAVCTERARAVELTPVPFPSLIEDVIQTPDLRECEPEAYVGNAAKRRKRVTSRTGRRVRKYTMTELATVAWHVSFFRQSYSAYYSTSIQQQTTFIFPNRKANI